MGSQQGSRQYPTGVRPHGNGIQIKFKPPGQKSYSYETLPWHPSPANLSKAGKLRRDIVAAVKHGTFRYADWFPDSPKATQKTTGSFAHYAQEWLDRPDHNWKKQSRYKFKGILNRVWMPDLYDKPIASITTAQLLATLKAATHEYMHPEDKPERKEPSQSTYNDWLLCVRGVFDTAILDGALTRATNPAAELRNKRRTTTEPDPFDDNEREAIIADIYQHDGAMLGAWFELGFFTGMRYPSEPTALTWQKFDKRKKELRVDQIRTREGIQASTKTGVARTLLLNSRATHAINKLKPITKFKNSWLFLQANGEPFGEAKRARIIWRASLTRLGIRYRDQYNMRHSFASWGLSNGLNPAFMATQLGHSTEEFFKTYAKWINATQNALQIELMERAIKNTKGGQKGAEKTG